MSIKLATTVGHVYVTLTLQTFIWLASLFLLLFLGLYHDWLEPTFRQSEDFLFLLGRSPVFFCYLLIYHDLAHTHHLVK